MGSRWRVIEAVALPMLTLLFLGLWQGFRHHTDAIRALRRQVHELEHERTQSNNTSLMEEQLEFLQRRQKDLEKQIGEAQRSQQSWRTHEHPRRQREQSETKASEPEMQLLFKPDPSLDVTPIP